MSSYLIEKYANLLTNKDVQELFDHLEKVIGSRLKTAEICGLERKTIYDWRKTGDMNLKTKEKVLKALIEEATEETLAFMMNRSAETAVDILRIYLSTIYEMAMDEKISDEDFLKLVSRFEKIREEYASLILDKLEIEVGDMLRFLRERATELHLTLPPQPIKIMRISRLPEVISPLIRAILFRPTASATELASDFNLPVEVVGSLTRTIEELPKMPISTLVGPNTAGTIPPSEGLSVQRRLEDRYLTIGNDVMPTS